MTATGARRRPGRMLWAAGVLLGLVVVIAVGVLVARLLSDRPGRVSYLSAPSTSNSPPRIANIAVGSPDPSTGAVTGTVSAMDPDGDPLTFKATTSSSGAVSMTSEGTFTYTPTARARHESALSGGHGAQGIDTVTITVVDSKGATTAAVATVPISPHNAAPLADVSVGQPDPATGIIMGVVSASDPEHDMLTYKVHVSPRKGALVLNPSNGSFTYTPTPEARSAAAALGADATRTHDWFTINVADGYGGSTTVPVTVSLV